MREAAYKVALVLLISQLGACAGPDKDDLLPQTGPTMEEVYRQHVAQDGAGEYGDAQPSSHAGIKQRVINDGAQDLAGYTRDAGNEIQSTFPRLPNPTLVMFVYPHLSTSSRLPVPGYSTSFPMYERTEYALPGEL